MKNVEKGSRKTKKLQRQLHQHHSGCRQSTLPYHSPLSMPHPPPLNGRIRQAIEAVLHQSLAKIEWRAMCDIAVTTYAQAEKRLMGYASLTSLLLQDMPGTELAWKPYSVFIIVEEMTSECRFALDQVL